MRPNRAKLRCRADQIGRFRNLTIEPLERRCLMAVGNDLDWQDPKTGPLAKAGQAKIELIRDYKQWQTQVGTNTGDARFKQSANSLSKIENNFVEMEIILADEFVATKQWMQNNEVRLSPSDAEYSFQQRG